MFSHLKLFSLSLGSIIFVSTLLFTPVHAAEENPFHMTDLSSGYMVADGHKKGHVKYHKMKKMDTDGDGTISKDEFMAHAEKKFSKKDANGDGVLSADEMKKGCGCKDGKCKYHKGKHGKDKHSDNNHEENAES